MGVMVHFDNLQSWKEMRDSVHQNKQARAHGSAACSAEQGPKIWGPPKSIQSIRYTAH